MPDPARGGTGHDRGRPFRAGSRRLRIAAHHRRGAGARDRPAAARPPRHRPGYRLRDGSRLAAADVSAAMLAQLRAARRGHAPGVVPLLAAAEELPVRTASLDLVTAFNCVHHFDLARFLAAAARVLRPGGQLFIYTRTPQQNARTIWGRYFPGFTEHEQRLHTQAAIRDAVRRTGGLTMITAQTFGHPRTSTAGRLQAQAEGRHYSTFSLYTPEELRASITAFLGVEGEGGVVASLGLGLEPPGGA